MCVDVFPRCGDVFRMSCDVFPMCLDVFLVGLDVFPMCLDVFGMLLGVVDSVGRFLAAHIKYISRGLGLRA